MRTDLGPAHSRLNPPEVIGAGIAFSGPGTRLADPAYGSSQRHPVRSELRPPVVVNPAVAPFTATPIAVTLASQRFIRTVTVRAPHSKLRPPAVVGDGIVFRAIEVVLARIKPVPTRTRLSPPQVVFLATELVLRVNLARIKPVATHTALRPPTVVFVATELTISVRLARITPPPTRPTLSPPAVVGAGIYFYPVAVKLVRGRAGGPWSVLSPPTVVAVATYAYPVRVTLVRGRAGRARSVLFPPIIPPVARPVEEELAIQLVRLSLPERAAHSRLSPPTVVNLATELSLFVHLAPSSRGRPKSKLAPPAVVGGGIYFYPVAVTLAPSSRGKPRSVLFPPIIPPTARPIETEVAVQLVRARLERQTLSRLRPPTVVFLATELTIAATLTRIRPVATRTALRPPVVVYLATELTVAVTLVRIKPPPTASALSAPTVVFLATELTIAVALTRIRPVRTLARILPPIIPPLAAPTRVELARIKPPPTYPRLQPPAVVGDGIYFYPVAVTLAPPSRGIPKSKLRPPAVVGAGIYFRAIDVELAYSRRGVPKSILRVGIVGLAPFRPVRVWLTRLDLTRRQPHPKLRAPARVGAGIVFRPLDVTLAPSTDIPLRRRTVADLKPPTVVNRAPAFLPSEIVALAPQSRGAPHSRLAPPTVVGGGIYFYPVRVKLAASSRGVPKSVLRPMLFAAPARPIEEEIAVQIVRTSLIERAPHSHLSPPTVVRQPPFGPLLVKLAPSTRGVPKSTLRPPPPPPPLARAIALRLAPQTRGTPKSRLAPPTVVRTAVLHPVRVTLVRIQPVPTRHLLAPPTAVFVATELTVRVTLAPSSRGKPVYLLRPPTVVGLAIELTIGVALVRIRPPHTVVRLSPPAVVTPYQPPLVTTLSVHLAVVERVVLGPRLAAHTRLSPPSVIVIPIPGFTSGRSAPGGAAEGHDVPDAGGSAESKPRDRGESKDVASGGSTIRSVEGSAGEARDKRRPLT